MHLVYGTLVARWYVTLFGLTFLWRSSRFLGWRKTLLYAVVAVGVGALFENCSVKWGFPYTGYTFNPALRHKELFLGDVPLMVPLSYTFLGYFGFASGRLLASGPWQTRGQRPWHEYAAGLMLTVWALWIMDPVSRLGNRWFLGTVFHYRGPGFWFGLPLGSQAGFTLTAAILVGVLAFMARDEPNRAVAKWTAHPHLVALITYNSQIAWLAIVAVALGADEIGGSALLDVGAGGNRGRHLLEQPASLHRRAASTVGSGTVPLADPRAQAAQKTPMAARASQHPGGRHHRTRNPHRRPAVSAGTGEVAFGDPSFFAGDPDAAMAALRRSSPLTRLTDADCWLVADHAAVQEVSRDPDTFCSGRGVLFSDRGRVVAATDSLLYLDPPAHGAHRRLVSRAFTPRRVADLEPRIRTLASGLCDAVDPHAHCDLVDSLCAPLPLLVIAELLGLPASDHERFRRWSDAVMAAATELTDENALAALELVAYFDEQLDARAAAPTDDLLSALLEAEVDGTRLTRDEVQGFCMTLLVAGNETTRSLMSGGLVALAEHPEQRARLAADPGLVPAAVEEMLRWVSPIMAMARTATAPAELCGTALEEGDYVVLAYGAANRDEAAFG